MATAKRVEIVILCFALACCYVNAGPRVRPIAGPDIYKGQNVAKDSLVPGEKIVNVMNFGAKPDGEFDCTQAFMDAWRATCKSPGQNRLLIPQGRFLVSSMFFAGPCMSPKPITIQVVGTVLATTDISEYENGEWLMFEDIAGLKLIGGGTFDGQGQDSWSQTEDCEKSGSTCIRNPSSLYFNKVTNGVIQNIKSVNSKGFHVFVTNCANMRLRRIGITAPDTSPNTDGIHISHSINVKLSKCNIRTGDDCVSMIQGVNNVTINKVNCGPGHGISIGSLGKYQNELEVRGVRVLNCTFSGTDNGIRIKTWPDKYPGAASDITFSDITMQNVKRPIIIDQEYQCTPANCQKKPSLVKVSNVAFANVRGTTISPIAVDLRCSKQFPCQNIKISNIHLKHASSPISSRCANIKPVYIGMQQPPPC
ncbi:PREDICTED: exopolygalacturonase-like [Lupinus angustifolius]|uniref:exopolygalacturonase-like n=1 Tax=Lupinus angustifolius TaxID=3871 RepID=UPI00092FD6DE|nr:PREDICTED: exopolygalacturonase-like [Lupinus angustifolius]